MYALIFGSNETYLARVGGIRHFHLKVKLPVPCVLFARRLVTFYLMMHCSDMMSLWYSMA